MTNAYTIEGSSRRARNTHSKDPTRIIKFKFGKQLATLSFGAVALEKVEMRMHGHSRGQASAELGEKPPNRDTVQHFSRRPQAVALAGYQMIREEWCFGGRRPRNENNICGLKPFFRIRQ